MPYIGNSPGTGTRNRFIYTATASQTTFSGADDNGKTLKYADSDYVDVYLNGICLVPVTDYTSTSKTSIVLTQAASLNDTLEVVAYDIATISDTVSKADGGTFEDGITIRTADNSTQLTLESTDADATTGPNMSLYRNSSSPADSDQTGSIFFIGKDDGGNDTTYGAITTHIADASGGTEDGRLTLSSMKAGTSTETLHAVSGKVGINETEPDASFHIDATSQGNFTEAMRISNTGGGADEGNYIQWEIANTSGYGPRIGGRRESTGGAGLHFFTGEINGNPTEAMRIDHDGVVIATKGIRYGKYGTNNDSNYGLNIIAYYSFNDNNANSLGSDFNNNHHILYIVGGGGMTAVPMYPNGGSGVAWQVKIFDPDDLVFRNNQVDFTQGGSGANTFQIVVSSGGGSATIERTSGSAAYQVWVSRQSGGS